MDNLYYSSCCMTRDILFDCLNICIELIAAGIISDQFLSRCYQFDVHVVIEQLLHDSIVFIEGTTASAILNDTATRSLLVLSCMATTWGKLRYLKKEYAKILVDIEKIFPNFIIYQIYRFQLTRLRISPKMVLSGDFRNMLFLLRAY